MLHVRKMDVAAESVESALDALMSIFVHRLHKLLQQRRAWRYVEVAAVLHHVVHHRPRHAAGAAADFLPKGNHGWVPLVGLAKTHDEVETGGPRGPTPRLPSPPLCHGGTGRR